MDHAGGREGALQTEELRRVVLRYANKQPAREAAKHILDWALSQGVEGMKGEIIKEKDLTPIVFIEIEATPGLTHIRRTKTDGDTFLWKFETGTQDRTTDTIFAFANRGLGHTDDGKRGQPARQEYLDRDRRRSTTQLRADLENCETQQALLGPSSKRRLVIRLYVLQFLEALFECFQFLAGAL